MCCILAEPMRETFEIAPVGGLRIIAEPTLKPEGVDEGLDVLKAYDILDYSSSSLVK